MTKCWKCGKEIDSEIYRNSECPSCGADLHVCRGCGFYSPGSHNSCRESQADSVGDKERSNFCDWFRPGSAAESAGDGIRRKNALDAFNSLFGGGICL